MNNTILFHLKRSKSENSLKTKGKRKFVTFDEKTIIKDNKKYKSYVNSYFNEPVLDLTRKLEELNINNDSTTHLTTHLTTDEIYEFYY
jgi:hypothetical protein